MEEHHTCIDYLVRLKIPRSLLLPAFLVPASILKLSCKEQVQACPCAQINNAGILGSGELNYGAAVGDQIEE